MTQRNMAQKYYYEVRRFQLEQKDKEIWHNMAQRNKEI